MGKKIEALFHRVNQKTEIENKRKKKLEDQSITRTIWEIKDTTEKWRIRNKKIKETAGLFRIPRKIPLTT